MTHHIEVLQDLIETYRKLYYTPYRAVQGTKAYKLIKEDLKSLRPLINTLKSIKEIPIHTIYGGDMFYYLVGVPPITHKDIYECITIIERHLFYTAYYPFYYDTVH